MSNVFMSCDDLHEKISSGKPIVCIDASWHIPNAMRDGFMEYKNDHIPGAYFFDLDTWSEPDSVYPHTFPKPDHFVRMLEYFGIDRDREIVAYEVGRMCSAARFWFVMRAFGFSNIKLLRGGLANWKAHKFSTDQGLNEPETKTWTGGCVSPNPSWLTNKFAIQALLEDGNYQLVDVRPFPRFSGAEDEPRPGLKRGCISSSVNIPFLDLSEEDGPISTPDLQALFRKKGLSWDRPTVIMCGSGVTACVLFALLTEAGKRDICLYDGSWSEWGIMKQPLYAA